MTQLHQPSLCKDTVAYDQLTTIHDSTVQHGKYNDRVYLMKLGEKAPHRVLDQLEQLAEQNAYSKIFVKSRESELELFQKRDYEIEAEVPQMYRGEEKIYFAGKYLDERRKEQEEEEKIREVLGIAREKADSKGGTPVTENFVVRELTLEDTLAMADIYRLVFETYPFPIYEADYLKEVLQDHVRSFGVFEGEKLVALAACEMDRENLNVEMTDFATLPEYRGHKLAYLLLHQMEEKMRQSGIKVAYTIARSLSPGMNITFSRHQYKFAGTLKNNTNISGQIESMNVWHKLL